MMRSMEIQPVRLVQAADRTAPTAPARPVAKVNEGEKDVEVSRSQLLEASAAPIDAERIETIRGAIADGSYILAPRKIADAMIAAVQASRNS
jgi:flagellar biosynthesis anti-sigma factor FlgM